MSVYEHAPTFPQIRRPSPMASRPQERDGLDQESHESERDAAKLEPTAESLLMSGSSTHTQPSRRRFRATDIWWQEMMAATLLCAAVIASYATLAPYDGKSLPEWPRYITISALLSTYSVVLRLAATFLLAEGLAQLKWRWFNKDGGVPLHDLVLHDNATRGPVGSLQLLWRLPLPITWQWLGCVLIIIALAAGPVTQLVLQYEQCSVLMDGSKGTASVSRAAVFIGQGSHSGAAFISLTQDDQNAINSGTYTLGSARPECSSGNCTFAPYTSIGVCSECDDISDEMQFVMPKSVSGEQPGWISSSIPNDPDFSRLSDVSTNYSVGDGSTDRNFAAAQLSTHHGDLTFVMVMGPPKMTDEGTLVDCKANRTWACRGFAATSCKLSPCIRKHTAAMINGMFQEEVADKWINPFGDAARWPDGRYFRSAVNKSCLTGQQSSLLRTLNYTLNDGGPWLAYNGTPARQLPGAVNVTKEYGSELESMEQDLLDRQCLYAVDYFFLQGLSQYLGTSGTFAGNITSQYSASEVFLSYSGPQVMLAIYNYGNISFERTEAVWLNISTAFTNHMRLSPYPAWESGTGQTVMGDVGGSGPPVMKNITVPNYNLLKTNIPAPGLAYTTKTCLQVRWGWLAFPTILAALTLLFFTGVLLSSGGLTRDVRTWKSSPLPLLFFGSSISETLSNSQHVGDLNQVARKINVGFVQDGEGNMMLRKRGATIKHDSVI